MQLDPIKFDWKRTAVRVSAALLTFALTLLCQRLGVIPSFESTNAAMTALGSLIGAAVVIDAESFSHAKKEQVKVMQMMAAQSIIDHRASMNGKL